MTSTETGMQAGLAPNSLREVATSPSPATAQRDLYPSLRRT